jgi:hypothetical protein
MTTTKTNLSPAAVREWLNRNAEDLPWTMLGICEGIGAAPGSERAQVHDAVRYCVIAGFLTRTDTKMGPVFQRTGEGMRRVVLTDEQRKERKRTADAKRIRTRTPLPSGAAAIGRPKRSRAARVAVQAANTPAPTVVPKPKAAETVDQFLARGGRVQVLPTVWDKAAA